MYNTSRNKKCMTKILVKIETRNHFFSYHCSSKLISGMKRLLKNSIVYTSQQSAVSSQQSAVSSQQSAVSSQQSAVSSQQSAVSSQQSAVSSQ
jgi:hypothetical protein